MSSTPGPVHTVNSSFGRNYLVLIRRLLDTRWRGTPMQEDLEDAVQEVFVECLRPDGPLTRVDPSRGSVSGVLFGVVRNVARRFEERASKRKDRSPQMDSVLAQIAAQEATLSVMCDREWARSIVRLAGERMRARAENGSASARLRVEVLRLRFTDGLPIREIAAQWGVDADSVHKAYERARLEFREHLRRVVGEHTVRSEEDLELEVERVLELFR